MKLSSGSCKGRVRGKVHGYVFTGHCFGCTCGFCTSAHDGRAEDGTHCFLRALFGQFTACSGECMNWIKGSSLGRWGLQNARTAQLFCQTCLQTAGQPPCVRQHHMNLRCGWRDLLVEQSAHSSSPRCTLRAGTRPHTVDVAGSRSRSPCP